MSVPKYHEFMLPLLKLASDSEKHSMSEAYELMAKEFELTIEDRKVLTPSGQQSTFENRVGWARTYLKKAGLLASHERGYFEITDMGLNLLKEKPKKINKKTLMKYTEFKKFQTHQKKDENKPEVTLDAEKTPNDLIEENYQQLRDSLSEELLEKIKSCTDFFFEKLVVDLLLKMGYGGSRFDAGRAFQKSRDGGIDGIIKEDRLGLDVIYIQAKKWSNTKVGEREIRDFLGSLDLKNANKGVFITTSTFTKDAEESALKTSKKVILIDGSALTDLMIEHGLAVATESTYELKKIDTDYFIND